MRKFAGHFCTSIAVCAIAYSHPAFAQGAATAVDTTASDQDIVVTASRLRNESVEKAPVAVSVVSPKLIENMNASDLSNLSAIAPNTVIDIVGSSPGLAVISIRGFVTRTTDISTEPGVAVYVDGIYQTILTGSLVDTYDIDSIEVLRGPQGALLGKSAGAGAIMLNRSKPKMEFGGRVEVEYGSYNLARATGLVNVPLIPDVLALKIFGSTRHRNNWVRNLVPGQPDFGAEEQNSARAALLFTPSPDFSVYLTADYMDDHSRGGGGRDISPATTAACQAFNVCEVHAGMKNVTSATYYGQPEQRQNNVTGRIEWSLGGAKLTSLTGYRYYFNRNSVDLDHTPEPVLAVINSVTQLNQVSEEFRISSEEGGGLDFGGKFQWIVGGYLGRSVSTMDQPLLAFGGGSSQNQKVVRNSKALFAHADIKPIDQLSITGGVRHSWDKVRHDYNLSTAGFDVKPTDATSEASFENTSIEAGAQFEFASNKMIYYRYAEGYRSGGFVGFPGSAEAANTPFRPETSSSHEVGLKTRWLDGALTVNLTAFQTKFKDMQRDVVSKGPNGGFVQVTANAASAETKGIEADMTIRPVHGLSINMNGGYLKAKYTSFISADQVTGAPIDLSNNPITYAPKWTAAASIDYEHDLAQPVLMFDKVFANANGNYRSTFVFDPVTTSLTSPGYAVIDASVGFEGGSGPRYRVTFYVDNIANNKYATLFSNISDLVYFAHDNIGRTFGGKLSVKF